MAVQREIDGIEIAKVSAPINATGFAARLGVGANLSIPSALYSR
jgi:hypothetical protein